MSYKEKFDLFKKKILQKKSSETELNIKFPWHYPNLLYSLTKWNDVVYICSQYTEEV